MTDFCVYVATTLLVVQHSLQQYEQYQDSRYPPAFVRRTGDTSAVHTRYDMCHDVFRRSTVQMGDGELLSLDETKNPATSYSYSYRVRVTKRPEQAHWRVFPTTDQLRYSVRVEARRDTAIAVQYYTNAQVRACDSVSWRFSLLWRRRNITGGHTPLGPWHHTPQQPTFSSVLLVGLLTSRNRSKRFWFRL